MKMVTISLILCAFLPATTHAQEACESLFVSMHASDSSYNRTLLKAAVHSPNEIIRYFEKTMPESSMWATPMLNFLFPNGALVESKNIVWLAPAESRDFGVIPLGDNRVVDSNALLGALKLDDGGPYFKSSSIKLVTVRGERRLRAEVMSRTNREGYASKLKMEFKIEKDVDGRDVAIPITMTFSRKPTLLPLRPDIFWTEYFSGSFVDGVRERLDVPYNDEAARGLHEIERYQYRRAN